VQFRAVKLYRTVFARSSFVGATLSACNLNEADLSFTDFSSGSLLNSRLGGANLTAANLTSTVLHGVRGLTSQQLVSARTGNRTVLPSGAAGPYLRGSGAERPKVK